MTAKALVFVFAFLTIAIAINLYEACMHLAQDPQLTNTIPVACLLVLIVLSYSSMVAIWRDPLLNGSR